MLLVSWCTPRLSSPFLLFLSCTKVLSCYCSFFFFCAVLFALFGSGCKFQVELCPASGWLSTSIFSVYILWGQDFGVLVYAFFSTLVPFEVPYCSLWELLASSCWPWFGPWCLAFCLLMGLWPLCFFLILGDPYGTLVTGVIMCGCVCPSHLSFTFHLLSLAWYSANLFSLAFYAA